MYQLYSSPERSTGNDSNRSSSIRFSSQLSAETLFQGENKSAPYDGAVHEPPLAIQGASRLPSVQTIDPNVATWNTPDDPTNPQNWTIEYRWLVTIVCLIMSVNVTFALSAPALASQRISEEFSVIAEKSYLTTTFFFLGYLFGPLVWGPGSELVGRRPIFVVAMTAYTLLILGQALSPNIETLIMTRLFSGFFAAGPLTVTGGVIADIWPAVGRGPATTLFTASIFIGSVLGPIVGGFIIESPVSWRWIFWVMIIFAGVCTAIVWFSMPETYTPIILQKKANRLRKEDPVQNAHIYSQHEKEDWSLKGIVSRTILRPFKMLALEPILILITIYTAIVYGLLYGLLQAFPIIFMTKRGFTSSEDGLIFVGVAIGSTLGCAINYRATAHYPDLIRKWGGFPPPEDRLYGAMVGSPAFVIGIFWLGWTGHYPDVSWYIPAMSTIFIGTGISLIFMSFLSYLIDTYLTYSASAFAINTSVRSAVAAAFPLFTVQMFTLLGVNWACTIIGLVALLFAPSPFLFYKYGPHIRTYSKFAPCIDLKIVAEMEQEEEKKKCAASI